ncbi:DUF2934 domain-containing protein [Bosea sp. NBC_00550]|uniref:DUF2934 domain-containing protein n=1 Tax=Bosea sp. NBC_00550 TaxID=2969621 RepID=UPI00222E684F|nr:DUF2934 domain-containing protein [Bosea sp. NBC_00550]UZF92991.1 DUF2934 domain-containing protein [Bosea sp. NBC_00550]
MSREQIVRDTAYAIWEAEGKPEGRDTEHWRQAEQRVTASVDKAPKAKAPVKGKVTPDADGKPKAQAPLKAAATKAAPGKAASTKKV